MKNLASLILLLGLALSVYSQTDKEKAYELKNEAIHLMDSGFPAEAIAILNSAQKLDPDNINIIYEKAFAYQMTKDFDKSIEIAKPLLKHSSLFDQIYQLLGNSYDLKGEKGKAIKMYDKGLKKFPKSGALHLKKGLVLADQKKMSEALALWEKGIIMDPTYASNYYYASKTLANSDEKIWAIYYGEIFLNLETDTERSKEMSQLVFDTYKRCLPIKNGKWELNFSKKATHIALGNLKNLKFPFETVHNLAMEKGLIGVDTLFTIHNLLKIRQQFLTEWMTQYADRYPNLIFDYHDFMTRSNYFEPYLYCLLKDGNKEEFKKWRASHAQAYKRFLSWRKVNGMTFSNVRKTNRFSYD